MLPGDAPARRESSPSPLTRSDAAEAGIAAFDAVARESLRRVCAEQLARKSGTVELVQSLRRAWHALAPPEHLSREGWDRRYVAALGECLVAHFAGATKHVLKRDAGATPRVRPTPALATLVQQSAAIRVRAAGLIRRAAAAISASASRTHYQAHLLQELSEQRQALRTLMSAYGSELRAEGVSREQALELIGAAVDQAAMHDPESSVMAENAYQWALHAYEAAA